MPDIYQVLQDLHIPFEKHQHTAVHTVEQASEHYKDIDAGMSKNLFLRNAKGDTHYLVIIEGRKRLDLKKLAAALNERNLSFASQDRMLKYLGLTPGSVSPFGLINNTEKDVKVIVDADLLTYPKLSYHPNINTETLVISTNDLKKFLDWTGNSVTFLPL